MVGLEEKKLRDCEREEAAEKMRLETEREEETLEKNLKQRVVWKVETECETKKYIFLSLYFMYMNGQNQNNINQMTFYFFDKN